jgi:hypothetical protein
MYRNIILYVFLILFSFSSILGNEMWEKEIPPSKYLESCALSSEESSETTIILSYISLFSGLAMCSDPTNVEMTVVGIIALLGGGIVIVMDLLNDGPRTTVFKEFKKNKSLENNNEKEKLSYELLVLLAKESRKKRSESERVKRENNSSNNPSELLMNVLLERQASKMKREISERFLTEEEKALDNYLNQIVIK